MNILKPWQVAVLSAGVLVAGAHAQLNTFPGCSDLQASDFTKTQIFSRSGSPGGDTVAALTEPVAMDFNAVRSGDSVVGTDIYLIQRKGGVLKYSYATRKVKQIGSIRTAETVEGGTGDNGLHGIALDPGFATNRWVYFWYIPQRVGSNNYRGRLSRFTLGTQDTLQASTEKILLDIQLSKTRQYHSGGPMRFDAHGDLWVTIGNNGADLDAKSDTGSQYRMRFTEQDSNRSNEWGSSNTASMRGGVIRIHPDNSAKGYSIPAGNFGQYWADYFQGLNNTTLANQYRDTLKVLPEIYVKGARSNYSLAVHPTKRWVAWGEVNYNGSHDEFNLLTTPAFTGFPYFHANNVRTPGGYPFGALKDTLAPLNNSALNSGVNQLPPATRATFWYGTSLTATTLKSNVAIGGDIYVYDRNLRAADKFPPHFHNSWLLSNWWEEVTGGTLRYGSLYGVRIDSTTVKPLGTPTRLDQTADLFGLNAAPLTLRNPIQLSYGPDGALYILNYGANSQTAYSTGNPGMLRIGYTGTCKLTPIAIGTPRALSREELRMSLHGSRLRVLEPGAHEVTLTSVNGRAVFRASGIAGSEYDLARPAGSKGEVYLLRIRTDRGVYSRSLALF